MSKVYSIPSKYENNVIMLESCKGHVNKKNVDITAPQSKRSPKQTERVDVRVGMIL